MLMSILLASLFGNLLTGKGVMGLDKIPVRAGEDTIRAGQGF